MQIELYGSLNIRVAFNDITYRILGCSLKNNPPCFPSFNHLVIKEMSQVPAGIP